MSVVKPFIIVSALSACSFFYERSYAASATTTSVKLTAPSADPRPANRRRIQPNFEQTKDIKKLETQIKAVNLIIKTELDKEKKIQLFVARSQLQIAIARAMGFNRTRVEDMSEKEEGYLRLSKKTLTELIPFSAKKNKRLAEIYYLLGLIEYEYDRFPQVQDYFIKSINLDLKNVQAPSMALVVGELYYDKDKYPEAIKAYQWLYSRMTKPEKAMADYKTAWSYVGQGDTESAKKYLMRIIKQNLEPSFVEDSIKDLAFLIAQSDDEFLVINYGKENFSELKVRSKFYYQCLVFFLQKDKKKSRENLFNEVLSIESDGLQQAKIYALRVSYERKEYPTEQAYQAAMKLDQQLVKLNPKDREIFFATDNTQFEDNSETIIKNFVQAYTGKIRLPEQMTKEYAIQALKRLIETHLNYFPNSAKQDSIYGLWIDACYETKDLVCLKNIKSRVKAKIQSHPAMLALYTQAFLKIISITDEFYTKEPAKYEEELITVIADFLKEHATHQENLKLTRKISALLLKKEKYKDALPYAAALYKLEPNAENLYKLLFSQFKLGMFNEVVSHPDFAKYNDEHILELQREVSLALAQKSIESGNIDLYEQYIKKFLSTNPNKDKQLVVYNDYLRRLLKAKMYDKFITEWKSLKSDIKNAPELIPIRSTALNTFILDGYFTAEESLMKGMQNADLSYDVFVYKLFLNQDFDNKDLDFVRSLPIEKKNYLFGLLSLMHPARITNYFSQSNNLSESERLLLFNSYLFQKGHDNFTFNEDQLKPIATIVPQKMIGYMASPLFSEIDKISFPSASLSAAKYNKQIELAVEKTRSLRKKVPKELEKLVLEMRLYLVEKCMDTEKKTAQAILNSALPKDLSDIQIIEYRNGLKEIAAEFEGQYAEYDKIKQSIQAALVQQSNQKKAASLPELTPENMPSPPVSSEFNHALDIYKNRSPQSAVLFWDAQFASGNNPADTHYKGRSILLIKKSNTPVMRDYIMNELKVAKQDSLIRRWKELGR